MKKHVFVRPDRRISDFYRQKKYAIIIAIPKIPNTKGMPYASLFFIVYQRMR